MLWELDIENVAVISKAHISFTKGFNVFTGETGAGKSMLLGAIGAVLGNRVSKDIIRTGETKAKVTALFGDLSEKVCTALSELGLDISDNEVVISREITADRSVCHINGTVSTASMLKSVGKLLVDIHGQRDNYVLADPASHLSFIDSFAGNAELIEEYREDYTRFVRILKKLKELSMDEQQKRLKLEQLEFEINDISSAELRPGEEDALIQRKKLIKNSKELARALSSANHLLSGDDESDGIISMLEMTEDSVSDSAEFIPEMEESRKKLTDLKYELDEISENIKDKLSELSFDDNELETIEERLDVIFKLKTKYGNSVEAVLDHLKKAEDEYALYSDNTEVINKLNKDLDAALKKAKKSAAKLTESRKAAALRFSSAVASELKMLSMPNVTLSIPLKEAEMTKTGADELEIFISVNKGEELRPLAKVASGGEMSRIMLAIKNVISAKDDVPTQIFDEIDAGISGIAAGKVGRKLYEAAQGRQILCVTHLAQVAVFADNHLLIEKNTSDGRTFTDVKPMGEDEKVNEIARITSGENKSDLALAGARELLEFAEKEKLSVLKGK